MSIKFDESSKTHTVSFSKRHPITRESVQLRRIGIKSKAEAQRVYSELVVQVNDKIKKKMIPTWEQHLKDYFHYLLTVDITNTTRYNREKLLCYQTIPVWGSRYVDEITHENIHELLNTRLKENKESYKKCLIKYIRGVFDYAVDTS